MSELVFIKHNDAFTDSLKIAEATGNDHSSVTRIVRKYSSDFGGVEFMDLKSKKSNRGRPTKIYLLNEEQATLLVTYLENTEAVREFKKKLVHQFYQMRRLLAERSTQTWVETRQRGKITRKEETDVLKALVEYAEAQGSKNANNYYRIYSRLANKTAGITTRDTATVHELNMLELYENIILRVISEGIANAVEYHKIYKDCEARLSQFKMAGYISE